VKNKPPEEIIEWLQSKPSLGDLGVHFPEWLETVRQEISVIVSSGKTSALPNYFKRITQEERHLKKQYSSRREDKRISDRLVKQLILCHMAHLVIKQHLIAEATGIEKGKVRFNLLNGLIAQKLLFAGGLERKPVSMFWFRLVWPLLRQKKLLMPLVQPEGIYCFYSRQLIDELAALIGTQTCLEIAAGDGTLARFLTERGTKIIATDDHSWKHEVKYPEFVIKREAQEALREYSPEVVLCSWPPAGNTFEQQVFRARSVQLYVVISSRHQLAAGNWNDYLTQSTFSFVTDDKLSRLVLPPELDAAVYIFRRKQERFRE
jgi:hypothetical protein